MGKSLPYTVLEIAIPRGKFWVYSPLASAGHFVARDTRQLIGNLASSSEASSSEARVIDDYPVLCPQHKLWAGDSRIGTSVCLSASSVCEIARVSRTYALSWEVSQLA